MSAGTDGGADKLTGADVDAGAGAGARARAGAGAGAGGAGWGGGAAVLPGARPGARTTSTRWRILVASAALIPEAASTFESSVSSKLQTLNIDP